MTADRHGNPMSGPTDAVGQYDHAIDRLLRFHPDVVTAAGDLVEKWPDVPMGQALMAYLYLMSTDAPDLAEARRAADALRALPANERERGHADAIDRWLAGDWLGASRRLDDVLRRWPGDLLALALGHQLDFFLGDAGNLRDRPGRSLPELDPDDPHTAFVRGMQAFGLEESGDYARAEGVGQMALDINRDDVWSIHAVVHTFEMTGRVDTGVSFLRSRQADWGSGNLFTVHNWWHYALYCLEAGLPAEALNVYDEHIHNAESLGVPLEMLDASALLWRLLLDGVDSGDRFATLADAWAGRAVAEPWYVFNDLHVVMAFAGANRRDDGHAVIDRLTQYIDRAHGTNANMTAEVGLPACRAIVAFSEGRYDDVVAELTPIRAVLHRFGGSHAQRDALQRTLLEAALRSGRHDWARALTAERLSAREASVYGWMQRARALRTAGHDAEASRASERAQVYRSRFAAALTG
jgi:hypothetical protein